MNKDFVFELDGGEDAVKKKTTTAVHSDESDVDEEMEENGGLHFEGVVKTKKTKKTAVPSPSDEEESDVDEEEDDEENESDEEESDVDEEEEDDVDEEEDVDEEGDVDEEEDVDEEDDDDVDEEMEEQPEERKKPRSKPVKVHVVDVHGTEEDKQASSFFSSSAGASFSANSFGELNLSRPLIRACQALGYKQPTPIQVFFLYSSVISLASDVYFSVV